MTFLDCFDWPKFDFTQNRSGGKIIKFQQSQALTPHFESFWSMVDLKDSQAISSLSLFWIFLLPIVVKSE